MKTAIRRLRGINLPFGLPFPFSIALAAGAILRLVAMIGYPGALWFAGDSYVYLGAALRLQPNLSKTTGYSLFLYVLEPFHSLTLVAGLQHLMGLAVAVMIYLLLRRNGVSKRWSTVATLPVLLDGFVIEDEHMVMAEALFTFLVVLSMLLILWPRPGARPVAWPVALLAGLLAGYAVTVRSQGLPVLVLFPVVLLVRGLRRDGAWAWRNWRGWLAAAVMAVGCVAPVAGYVVWFHSWWGSYTLSNSDGFYLWGRVSSFAQCSEVKPPASEQAICPSGTPSSRTPPGDYIWHVPQVHHMANGGPVTAANDALLRDFAIRAVEAQPLGYVHAVLGGLWLAVEWPRHPYPDAGTVYLYYFHLTPWKIPADHSWVKGGTAYSDAVQYGHATPSRVVRPVAILIDGYQRVFYTYGPLFGLIMIIGLGGVVRLRGLRTRSLRALRLTWSPRAGSMLPWATAVVLLVFPIAVADFDYRYLLPVLPFACLAAGLAFAPARDQAPAPSPAPEAGEPSLDQRSLEQRSLEQRSLEQQSLEQQDDLTSQLPTQAN
jgi:Dolichyl-phosphate-mannose-protein mannosyltransferase